MKSTMELNKMGLHEMSLEEMQETEGGFWGLLIAAAEIVYDICTTSDQEFQSGVAVGKKLAGGGTKKP